MFQCKKIAPFLTVVRSGGICGEFFYAYERERERERERGGGKREKESKEGRGG